ncbi:mitochondrial carrier domain-containing protein, partial [Syncephalis pseudoplumigaleata]
FVAGAIAACGAVTITNPLEVVKTRMQLQGELNRKAALHPPSASGALPVRLYKNTLSALVTIAKHEGVGGLQRGLGAAYVYQIAMNGVRLGSYEPVKRLLLRWSSHEQGSTAVDPFWCRVVAGGTAGATGALLGSPLFLVKTRLQSYSKQLGMGYQHQYRGVWHALRSVFRNEGGAAGLYHGAGAAVLRTSVGSAVQLTTYDSCKVAVMQRFGLADGLPAHMAASFLTGIVVCCAMNPFDVVSTRVYNQGHDPVTGSGRLYRGPIDCFVKTIRAEGIAGLYKGIGAHYLRIGPHTILTFVFL